MVEQASVEQETITVFHVYGSIHSIPLTDAIGLPKGSTIKDLIAYIGGDFARDAHIPEPKWISDGHLEPGTAYEIRELNLAEKIQRDYQ